MVARRFKIGPFYGALLASVLIGYGGGMAWGQAGLAPLLFVTAPVLFWLASNSRLAGVLVMFTYFLVASRGLPGGAAVFFGDDAPPVFGVALWLAAGVFSALPWMMLWRGDAEARCRRLPWAFIISVLPPLGFVSWTSPLLASAALFPGMGIFGFALLIVLLISLALRRPFFAMAVLGVSLVANVGAPDLGAPLQWTGVDTHYGRLATNVANEDARVAFRRMMDISRGSRSVEAGTLQIYPETVLGAVDEVMRPTLQDLSALLAKNKKSALVGAELPGEREGRYTNALIGLGELDGFVHRQRVPVPVTMWRPWDDSGAYADWYGGGVTEIFGKKITILICYEQLILWPSIVSSFHRPEVLVGVANDWWARNSSVPAVQAQSLSAISRAFGWSLVSAVNL